MLQAEKGLYGSSMIVSSVTSLLSKRRTHHVTRRNMHVKLVDNQLVPCAVHQDDIASKRLTGCVMEREASCNHHEKKHEGESARMFETEWKHGCIAVLVLISAM